MPAERHPVEQRVIALAVIATAAFVAFLVLRGRQVELAVHLYLVVLTALGSAFLIARVLRGITLQDPPTILAALRRPRPRPERPRAIEEVEHALDFAGSRAVDVHFWLRPHLVRVAAHRLGARHGIDLERRPDAARDVLSPELWEIVRPGRDLPDRGAPGLPRPALRALVEELERL